MYFYVCICQCMSVCKTNVSATRVCICLCPRVQLKKDHKNERNPAWGGGAFCTRSATSEIRRNKVKEREYIFIFIDLNIASQLTFWPFGDYINFGKTDIFSIA